MIIKTNFEKIVKMAYVERPCYLRSNLDSHPDEHSMCLGTADPGLGPGQKKLPRARWHRL